MASVNAALKIIRNVNDTAENVCVNKNQCKRLAERFGVIGKALQDLKTEDNEGIFLEQILAVLNKGKALVESYAIESDALRNVLYRADNHAAFKEVHEEIDALRTYLDLDHVDKVPQTRKTTLLLSSDAETDRREMLPNMHRAIVEWFPTAEGDVENMEKAVTEKCYNAESSDEDLNYLNIPVSAIHLQGAIKELKPLEERKSKGDAHLEGLALVEKGTWNGCNCAIKVFKSEKIQWNTAELHKEVASLVKLRHPHVTQLIGCAQDKKNTYVLYEMMDSDLRVLMESRKKNIWTLFGNRPFSRTEEVSIITQIARGMFYLHEKGLVHGELKCTNLLVKEGGGHIDVKVADFHCSRQLGQAPTTKYKPAHRPRWMPPEDFKYCEVGHPDADKLPTDDLLMKGDVYSFAMTCYEVVTGKYPFDGVKGEALNRMIKAGERPKLPEAMSEDLKRLITKCWHADPEQRPSFQDICYVLKVEAVNLSQVQKLLAGLCFGTANDRAAVAPAGQEWSDLLNLNDLGTKPVEETDDATKSLPHYLKIKPVDLKPLQELGSGASAEVYEASWIGCRFAVKWLKVEHVTKLRQEVGLMIQLLHPHVIRLVGFSVLWNRCAIVMELMDKSLRELIESRTKDPKHATPFSESEVLAIITKVALGMDFLHSKGVAHGDLKCGNVLVRNEHLKTKMDVKIVDLGLSRLLGKGPSEKVKVVGRHHAPEVILSMKDPVDIDPKAADVYSFAMVCYEIITGKEPFCELPSTIAAAVHEGGGTPKLDDSVRVRPGLKELLRKCWSLKPQDRPTFGQILRNLTSMS